MLKLCAGLLTPQDGSVRVAGQILGQDIAYLDYFQSVGYVNQEPNIFDASIRDNLLVYLPDDKKSLGDEEKKLYLTECLSQACCDFVFAFPEGFDTIVGER